MSTNVLMLFNICVAPFLVHAVCTSGHLDHLPTPPFYCTTPRDHPELFYLGIRLNILSSPIWLGCSCVRHERTCSTPSKLFIFCCTNVQIAPANSTLYDSQRRLGIKNKMKVEISRLFTAYKHTNIPNINSCL